MRSERKLSGNDNKKKHKRQKDGFPVPENSRTIFINLRKSCDFYGEFFYNSIILIKLPLL